MSRSVTVRDLIALLKKYGDDDVVLVSKDDAGTRMSDIEDELTAAWSDEDGDVVTEENLGDDESTRDMTRCVIIWPTK